MFGIQPINLIDGIQDYSGAVIPTNFHRILSPRIIRTDVSPAQNQPIKVVKHLEVEVQRKGSINTIESVSYEPSIPAFRINIPPSITGTQAYQLAMDYQVSPTKVTALSQTICPPDKYFNVMVEGALWMTYRLADDPRTGTTSINRPGDRTTAGQKGVFMDALADMVRQEDMSEGLDTRFPEDPMGWTRLANPGIFPTI